MFAFVAVALVLASGAAAWDCSGHMLVASIAAATMKNSTYYNANILIDLISQYYPRTADFITAACWADDLRGIGVEVYNSWHFINLPYVSGPVQFQLDAVPYQDNVVWGVEQARNVLNASDSTLLDKAIFLRFLMHFVGDMHQPLHIMTMYSDNFLPPGGDNGGNLFLIQGVNQSSLHSFFDAGGGQWDVYLERPLLPNDTAWIKQWTLEIMSAYPASMFTSNITDPDFDDWLLNIFKHSVNDVYWQSIYSNDTLPATYIQNVQQLCMYEVALAGYRLAYVLDSVFANNEITDVISASSSRLRGAKLAGKVRL